MINGFGERYQVDVEYGGKLCRYSIVKSGESHQVRRVGNQTACLARKRAVT